MLAPGRVTFRDLLQKPEFTTIEGLIRATENLPQARLDAISTERGVKILDRQAVVNAATDQPFAVVSDSYKLIQHNEALAPIIDGLRNLDIPFKGSLFSTASSDYSSRAGLKPAGGSVGGMLLFGDHAAAQFKEDAPGHGWWGDDKEPFAVGLEFGNSIDATMSFYARGFAVTKVCSNGAMMQKVLGELNTVHLGKTWDPAAVMADYEALVGQIFHNAASLPAIVQAAAKVALKPTQARPVLYGIDLPETHIDAILSGFNTKSMLVGPQKEHGRNLKTLFDATTNYYSNTYDRSPVRARELLGRSTKILTEPLDRLLAAAAARSEAEKAKEAGKAEAQIQTAPVVKAVQ